MARIITDEQNRLGRPLPVNTLLVLNMLRDIPRSDAKQLSEALNLSEASIKAVLDRAIETGLVEGCGGRGEGEIISSLLSFIRTRRKRLDTFVNEILMKQGIRYQELIISVARSSEYILRAGVVNLPHVKESKAYGLLKDLVKQGILAPVNKGRYAKYKLIQ